LPAACWIPFMRDESCGLRARHPARTLLVNTGERPNTVWLPCGSGHVLPSQPFAPIIESCQSLGGASIEGLGAAVNLWTVTP
jgi:hypothetical protein